jgi:hypothetical protein
MVKGCPTAAEDLDRYLGFREAKAAELLFSDCLKRFETASKRSAMATMFGGNAIITPMTRSKTTVIAAPTAASAVTKAVSATALSAAPKAAPKVAVQSSISNYLLDSFLVSNIRKKERQAKKKKLEEKLEEKQE